MHLFIKMSKNKSKSISENICDAGKKVLVGKEISTLEHWNEIEVKFDILWFQKDLRFWPHLQKESELYASQNNYVKMEGKVTLEVTLKEDALRWLRKWRTKVFQKVLTSWDRNLQDISPWLSSEVREITLVHTITLFDKSFVKVTF